MTTPTTTEVRELVAALRNPDTSKFMTPDRIAEFLERMLPPATPKDKQIASGHTD